MNFRFPVNIQILYEHVYQNYLEKVWEKLLKKTPKNIQMFEKNISQIFINKSDKTIDFTEIQKPINPFS